MINVGIIGYGKMGKIRHDVANAIDGVNVVSIYDSSVVKAVIKIEKSADDIINNSEIDAVFICTPNYLNKPLSYLHDF